jgi:D-amino-acid dehydrogenase
MKILVVGSGLIGLTTAYFLKRRGYEVWVADRREGPGLETSFANGALLTPGMSDPWNSPGSWRAVLSSMGRLDAPMQLRLKALPSMLGWGWEFLRNSAISVFERNTFSNLALSILSLQMMEVLRQQTGIEYGRAASGSLRIFRDARSLDQAAAAAAKLSSSGLTHCTLSAQGAVDLEPALNPIAGELAGAIYYPIDEIGDAYRFCVELVSHAEREGTSFNFGINISKLLVDSGRVVAAVDGRSHIVADHYVVAAGSYSTRLLKTANVRVPVQPVKGYSMTFDGLAARAQLKVPVVDDQLHAVIVPLNGAIRVAGTAEFAGYDRDPNPARTRNLVYLLNRVLPHVHVVPEAAKAWNGLRAMSADGVPIIGPTRIANLWVNTGHGHLGWTMAAGSAQLLADLMFGEASTIDPAPFALARFMTA